MSLTSILNKERGRTNLKNWFRYHFPNPGLEEKREIIVNPKQPHSSYSGEIGTAFDYLFRFNLERLNKKTYRDEGQWVAHSGLRILIAVIDKRKTQEITIGYDYDKRVERLKFKKFILREFIRAKVNHEKFLEDGQLTRELIKSSLLLAKLDVVYRTNIIDANLNEIENDKVLELEELFNHVPWDKFKSNRHCLLNPSFGDGSALVGGADADLIIDNTLVDIKTNRNFKIKRKDLNQIIGYCLLARIGKLDEQVNSIGIYFARYGFLWKINLKDYYKDCDISVLAAQFVQLIKDRNLNLVESVSTKSTSVNSRSSRVFQAHHLYFIDKDDFKCPFCESKSFLREGSAAGKYKYKCKDCEQTYLTDIDTTVRREKLKNLNFDLL